MLKRVRYCDVCRADREVEIKSRPATYTFRDEPFSVNEEYSECKVCQNDVTDEELDNRTLQTLKKLYETKFDYSPDKLKELRNSFDLPQTLFAKLLNIGVASIKRYETGASAPDSAQISIYKMLKNDTKSIKQFFEHNKHKFTTEEFKIVYEKLAPFFEEEEQNQAFHLLETIYQRHANCEDSGFAPFNLEKLTHMILYFARENVKKTKLMKLLWYSDFLMYKRYGIPISGTPYYHLPYGPVPKNHDLLLGCLESVNWISINEEVIANGFLSILIRSKKMFNSDCFSDPEWNVLRYVEQFFEGYGSAAISEFAHQEEGWKKTSDLQIISYKYSNQLQLV